MPRAICHPLALFSLKPCSPLAHVIVAHPSNTHLQSFSRNGDIVLDVGFNIRSQSRDTLATLGRNDTDIVLTGSSIARVQCSFELDPDSGVVMLYDRSNSQTTQVFGDNVAPFEYGRLRRVVVQDELNTIVGMGGVGCDHVQFELIWHQDQFKILEKVKSQEAMPCDVEENPRLARTVDEAPTAIPSQRVTRIHTPGERNLRMRWKHTARLGSGQFGVVNKCIDIDSGKFMAVKLLRRPLGRSQEDWREELHYTLKREVETLSNISHPHIVDYITSQGWDGQEVEIFMGLKEGTLKSMVESGNGLTTSIADSLFPQMLRALDCLAFNGIVHRDIKPENILYVSQPSGHQFQLGDFGLCNRVVDAATFAGSYMYMAPEMFQKGDQTSKLDVWSLFVTILWILDAGGLRSSRFKSVQDIQETVLYTALNIEAVSKIREMAVVSPKKRASAAQMLIKCYDGVGLSTPRNRVPALLSSPSIVPAAKAPVVASPAPTNRAKQTRQRDLQKNKNIFAIAAQRRDGRVRDLNSARKAARRLQKIRLLQGSREREGHLARARRARSRYPYLNNG